MFRINYAITILCILFVTLGAHAGSVITPQTNVTTPVAPSASGLLQSYNVSNTLIASLTYTNIQAGSATYLLAYSASTPEFLINSTGGTYSIILNVTQIQSIISPYIIQHSLSQINTTYLNQAMKEYNQSSAQALGDCINETGLDTNTCTLDNNCASCNSVPVCRKVFAGTGGVYGGFAEGVMQLELEYGDLEGNFSLYSSSLNSLSASSSQSSLTKVIAAFDNISSITNFIYQNPVFPPPQTADYSQCNGYGSSTGNVTSNGGPWYCSSLGFCEYLTYNYTLLGNIQSYLNSVSSLPISTSQTGIIADNISTNENTYVAPLVTSERMKQADEIANVTLQGYNASISNATILLTHISNSLLQTQIDTLQANYSALKNNYVSVNLVALNKSLAVQYSALKATYAGLNATYSSVRSLAANNTVELVELQLGNPNPSLQITSLSFRQAGLNSQLGAGIKNLSMLNAQLKNISAQAKPLRNNPSLTQSIARQIDAPVATAILAALGTSSYSQSVSLAPFLSLLPELIVGIIVIGIVLLYRSSLTKKHRIAYNSKTRKNWSRLLMILVVLVVIVVIATFVIASSANQSAPISAFISAVHASKTVIIALNGTNNTAMVGCAQNVKASLAEINKPSKIITMNGIACNNGAPLETIDKCLASYAANNEPVIILTNSSAESINAYSYYGSILSINGDSRFMSTCVASTMIR